MEVVARADGPGNMPQRVVIELPDWGQGYTRTRIELSIWEALQLRAALNKALP